MVSEVPLCIFFPAQAHAIIEGDIAVEVIPAIEIPLNLANCTCDDLEDATENFQFPIPGVTHQCSVDDTTCLGFLCHISFQDTQLDSDAVVDPCSESIAVTVRDSSGVQVFRQVFSESSAIQFEVESFSPTVYVLISHYTYSMRVSVSATGLVSLACGDPLPKKAREERVWGHRYTKPVFYPSSCRGRFKGHEYLLARPAEPAGATKGQPWTRAAAVESAKFIAERLRH